MAVYMAYYTLPSGAQILDSPSFFGVTILRLERSGLTWHGDNEIFRPLRFQHEANNIIFLGEGSDASPGGEPIRIIYRT